jgi:hypothetical protein
VTRVPKAHQLQAKLEASRAKKARDAAARAAAASTGALEKAIAKLTPETAAAERTVAKVAEAEAALAQRAASASCAAAAAEGDALALVCEARKAEALAVKRYPMDDQQLLEARYPTASVVAMYVPHLNGLPVRADAALRTLLASILCCACMAHCRT